MKKRQRKKLNKRLAGLVCASGERICYDDEQVLFFYCGVHFAFDFFGYAKMCYWHDLTGHWNVNEWAMKVKTRDVINYVRKGGNLRMSTLSGGGVEK